MNVGASADIKSSTPETLFLLIFCQTLRESKIGQTVTNVIYEELKQNDNPTSLNTIIDKIGAITSNFNCAKKTSNHLYRVRRDEEEDHENKHKKEKDCYLCGGCHEFWLHQWHHKCVA